VGIPVLKRVGLYPCFCWFSGSLHLHLGSFPPGWQGNFQKLANWLLPAAGGFGVGFGFGGTGGGVGSAVGSGVGSGSASCSTHPGAPQSKTSSGLVCSSNHLLKPSCRLQFGRLIRLSIGFGA
jgi:hypothetical protein